MPGEVLVSGARPRVVVGGPLSAVVAVHGGPSGIIEAITAEGGGRRPVDSRRCTLTCGEP